MKIRRAHRSEAEAISCLLTDLSKRYVLPDLSEEGRRFFLEDLAAEKIRARMNSGFEFFVAEAEDAIAGVAATSSPTHLFYLFVDTPYQRQGLARQLLLKASASWRQSTSSQPLTVNASRYAEPAYRRLGFRPTGDRQVKHGVSYYPMAIPTPDDLIRSSVR